MMLKPILLLSVCLGCAGTLYAARLPQGQSIPDSTIASDSISLGAVAPDTEPGPIQPERRDADGTQLDPVFQFDRPKPTLTATPTLTLTPFYGRCVEDLDRKLHCALFPGRGESRCQSVNDCYTPTPTPTPTTVPEAPRQCLCSCVSQGAAPEYMCSRPFEFRMLRLRWVCPDVEAGTFPKTFAREVGTVPDNVDSDYCNRWNDTATRGHLNSRSPEDGERCLLNDCVQAYVK